MPFYKFLKQHTTVNFLTKVCHLFFKVLQEKNLEQEDRSSPFTLFVSAANFPEYSNEGFSCSAHHHMCQMLHTTSCGAISIHLYKPQHMLYIVTKSITALYPMSTKELYVPMSTEELSIPMSTEEALCPSQVSRTLHT